MLALAKYGADVNAVTEMDGDTILHLAYKEDRRDLIDCIINELKVDRKIVNKKGKIAEEYKTYYCETARLFYSLQKNRVNVMLFSFIVFFFCKLIILFSIIFHIFNNL